MPENNHKDRKIKESETNDPKPEPSEPEAELEFTEEAAEKPAEPEETLESCQQKAQNYWDQLLRLQAEFANYRKRTEKEKAEAIRFGREVILERVISLMDVMEQALKHSNSATDITSLRKGFEMVVNEFLRFLKSEGAEPIKTVGQKFDPHIHEALEQTQTDKQEENNLIIEEIQKGYSFNGRLLRPAKVKVAKLKNEQESESK